MACDWKVKYCPKCGDIDPNILNLSTACDYCGTLLQETEYIFEDVTGRGNIRKEVRTAIFEEYIKDNSMYSEEAAKNREEKERHIDGVSKSAVKNIPKCPICQSTNLSKISSMHKAGKILAFGVFGMGDNGKTWKCNNCGSKF